MRRILHALRTWFRGDRPFSRRPIVNRMPRIELLEDRLAPAGDFRSVIGLDAAQTLYPYRGTGYTVAILDTGIDYNHPDLGGGFGAGRRVVAGYDFINNNANPMDDNGHGTHLAGIIGSSNPASSGVAPDVHFVALKVLDSHMNGNWTAVDNALKWVINHKTEYNIVAINLSLGSGNYASNPYNLLESDFASLKNLGVFTAVAAGNKYFTVGGKPGLSYPSISPNVVSVGATWAANAGPVTFSTGATESNPTVDHIVSFTQRSAALSILAPGAWITSTWLNGGYHAMGGTSMATAVVSGAAVLLHQAYDQTGHGNLATQDNLLQLMRSTGVAVLDANYGTDNVPHTGLWFKRLNLKAALDAVGQPIAPLTFAPIANQTLPAGSTLLVPLSANSPTGSPVAFTVRQVTLPALADQLDQQHASIFSIDGNQLSIRPPATLLGTFSIVVTANDGHSSIPRTFTVTEVAANTPPVLAAIPDQTTSHGQDTRVTLNATDADGDPLTYSAQVLPINGQTPALQATIVGNQLTIHPTQPIVGTFTISATVSDGAATAMRTFSVTLTNAAPSLVAIGVQTLARVQASLAVALSASDPDNDALTFGAVIQTSNAAAYQLNQQYAFHAPSPTYYLNLRSSNEKWIVSRTNTWFALLPNGNLYRWSQSMAQTLTAANLVATLDPTFYAEPRLLWNANPPVTPALTLSFQGNQLTIQRPASLTGVFFIDMTVSDGWLTTRRTMQVTLN